MNHLKIDPQSYASQGGAILGIRDSGKSYTAMKIAETLFDAGIPFVAFDPIGLWRFMRVPGKGKGYPIVVAGGEDGDLPLTPANAAAIVRAAMQDGVSLVIDLFDPKLSKNDWKRIVESCVSTLLFENKEFGLRHIFIEEAAEFVPQIIPKDGETAKVYSIIERLARMGGNRRLGYTLINQRAEQVNKAVLELCDNLFLHRQKGKNSINSLGKWLDVAGVSDARRITDSLPTLPQGECWEWLAGESAARLVKVPTKNSFHPDRRTMMGDAGVTVPKRVDAGKFVSALKGRLGEIEAEAKANDPKMLQAEVRRLTVELAKKPTSSQSAGIQESGVADIAKLAAEAGIEGVRQAFREAIEPLRNAFDVALASATEKMTDNLRTAFDGKLRTLEQAVMAVRAKRNIPAAVAQSVERRPSKSDVVSSSLTGRSNNGDGTLTTPQRRILASLGFWKSIGHDAPSRPQVAAVSGYTHTSGSFRNTISSLNVAGLIHAPDAGRLALTSDANIELLPSPDEARDKLLSIMGGPERKIVDALKPERLLSREDVALRVGYEVTSGSFRNTISSLNVLGVLTKSSAGHVALSDWARAVLS